MSKRLLRHELQKTLHSVTSLNMQLLLKTSCDTSFGRFIAPSASVCVPSVPVPSVSVFYPKPQIIQVLTFIRLFENVIHVYKYTVIQQPRTQALLPTPGAAKILVLFGHVISETFFPMWGYHGGYEGN